MEVFLFLAGIQKEVMRPCSSDGKTAHCFLAKTNPNTHNKGYTGRRKVKWGNKAELL